MRQGLFASGSDPPLDGHPVVRIAFVAMRPDDVFGVVRVADQFVDLPGDAFECDALVAHRKAVELRPVHGQELPEAVVERAGEVERLRVELDDANEKVGKKIREAAMAKVPWTIVVGGKEAEGGDMQINVFGQEEKLVVAQGELVAKALEASQVPM